MLVVDNKPRYSCIYKRQKSTDRGAAVVKKSKLKHRPDEINLFTEDNDGHETDSVSSSGHIGFQGHFLGGFVMSICIFKKASLFYTV